MYVRLLGIYVEMAKKWCFWRILSVFVGGDDDDDELVALVVWVGLR